MSFRKVVTAALLFLITAQIANAGEISGASVQKDLIDASNKLTGVGKNLCAFLASDLPKNYTGKTGMAATNWIKAGSSLDQASSPISTNQLESSLMRLKKTEAGLAIFSTLENHQIQNRYLPLTIHVGNIHDLLNTDAPMAFNTVIQTKQGAKGIPFVVLNAPAYKKNTSESKVALIVANELYDILGRMVAGEQVAATSNYQALGIVLSDIVLNNELNGSANKQYDKKQMVVVYKKAIKNYAGDVPSINYSGLNAEQKQALDELTKLATSGAFTSFKALDGSNA
jgi:hypothetical protein